MKNLLLIAIMLCTTHLFAQDIIFEDGFETDHDPETDGIQFHPNWTATPGTDGIVDISPSAKNEGLNGVRMGKSTDGGFATNTLDLTLDLSGYEQVELLFDIAELVDENHEEDGLFLSDDNGASWKQVHTFNPESWCNNQWGTYQPFDIDKLAADAGLSLNSQFKIRIQQHDNGDYNTKYGSEGDGFYIDNVIVRESPITYATLPFEDNFDDGTMKTPWAWAQPFNTVTDPSTISPISQYGLVSNSDKNNYWVAMRNKCDVFAANALDLHLNLAGKSNVELIFDIYDYYEDNHTEDGIYFSDNGGGSFVKVHDFVPENWCDLQWGTSQPFDIDKLATDAGLSLNDKFVIRFQQYDNGDANTKYGSEGDGLIIDKVIVRESPVTYATLPFEDNFDDGTMKTPWAWVQPKNTVTDPNTISPISQYGLVGNPDDNNYWIRMQNKCDAFAANAVDLHLNLAGKSNVELLFDIYDFYEDNHTEDGIFFSEDGGKTFVKVYDFKPESWCDTQWSTFQPFDIDKLAADAGLSLTDKFVIRFQQYDNGDANTAYGSEGDGLNIDNVIVRESPITYATLPFEDNFDDGTMKTPWAWAQPDSTVSDMNTIIPSVNYGLVSDANKNSFWVYMQKLCDGPFATNALDLHLNLLGQSDVELAFDIKDWYDETHTEDGIYFSDDGGKNFKKVVDWDPASWADNKWFTHPSVNVKLLAIQNELQLTDKFVIRFQQYDNGDTNTKYGSDGDGIYIDNVFVRNSKLPYISTFSPGIGPEDREVTISGGNFANSQEVHFNEVKADTFMVIDSATLIVKVPAGATTGKISVTNTEGKVFSENEFIISSDDISAPFGLDATAQQGNIKLVWQDTATNETGFFVEKKEKEEGSMFTQIATLSANATTYGDADVTVGKTYVYRVRAFNALGNSAYSMEEEETAIDDPVDPEPEDAPATPEGLTATASEETEAKITLTWKDVENEDGYKIYRSDTEDGTYSLVTEVAADVTTFTDQGILFDKTYFYKVEAFNSGGNSEQSQVATASTPLGPLGFEDEVLSGALKLYPNPAESTLHLSLEDAKVNGTLQIRLLNQLGQEKLATEVVKSASLAAFTLDTSHLPQGVYFLEITQEDYRVTRRVVKQ